MYAVEVADLEGNGELVFASTFKEQAEQKAASIALDACDHAGKFPWAKMVTVCQIVPGDKPVHRLLALCVNFPDDVDKMKKIMESANLVKALVK